MKVSRYGACIRKKRYKNLEEAIKKRELKEPEIGKSLWIYQCIFCNKFHLTSDTPPKKYRINEGYFKRPLYAK